MNEISTSLIENYGFLKVITPPSQRDELDFNKFSCVKRIHISHYLYYSDIMKHFTIAFRYDKPKGISGAGGGVKEFDYMMLPTVIENISDVENILIALKIH